MAAATASILSPPLPIKAAANFNRSKASSSSPKRIIKVKYITGLNSFGGLKAQNNAVSSLGLPVSTEQSYAMVVSSLYRSPGRGGSGSGGGRGGALSSTCNAIGEIFKIAAVMNALTLVGVAVGFVLLRIEAAVEESE